MNDKLQFPADFVWGSATAAYQIEGAATADGRGESIWDRFAHIPGNVRNNDTGDVACDHYHRFKEDIKIMQELGLKAYRFSISWSRVLPDGIGRINEKGLQFYRDLIAELLKAGIEPYVTLYHWDLPQKLQDRGGWANDEAPRWFREYAQVLFTAFGGQVKHWITLNEPYCAAFLGHYEGRHAPGIRDFSTAIRVAFNLYRGHGEAVRCFRSAGLAGEIGITLNLMGRLPFSATPEDEAAAKRADGYLNRWFIEPIVCGAYPADMIELYQCQGVVLPEFTAADLQLISQPLDFIGLNYYNDFYVKEDLSKWPLGFRIENPANVPLTDRNWPVTETGFTRMLKRLKNEYQVANILVTENGASYLDIVGLDGGVHDTQRSDYLRRHLLALHEAIAAGVNVKGYFLWSLFDNFEWAEGYDGRFGMVYVDYATQERIIKDSGHYYAGVVQNNAIEA